MITLILILITPQPDTVQPYTGTMQVDDIVTPWTMLDIDPSLVVDNGAMQWLLEERASAAFFVSPRQMRQRHRPCVPELPTVVLLLSGFVLVRFWR